MKQSSTILALAGFFGLLAPASQAAITAVPGDLLSAFYSFDNTTEVVGNNTYIRNLGPASVFRDTATAIFFTNINTDLTTAFGPNWHTSGQVRWGLIGAIPQSSPTTAGDPNRTSYFSQPNGGLARNSSSFSIGSAERGGLANNITSVVNSSNGAPTTLLEGAAFAAVNGGAIIPISSINDYSEVQPPTASDWFSLSVNTNTDLTAGIAGTNGLDLYRVVNATTGAVVTHANSPGNITVGAFKYVGSFELTGTGGLSFVPEPTAGLLAGLCALAGFRRRRSS